MQESCNQSTNHLWEPKSKTGKIVRGRICVNCAASFQNIPKAVSLRVVSKARRVFHLIASLSLSDKNESIGAYDREAEVDKDDGALGTDVPEGWKRQRKN